MLRKYVLAALGVALCSAGQAFGQAGVYGTVDPNSYARPHGAPPAVSYDETWQTDPFGVGYTLTGGYRSLYSGAPQPIGHETIMTHGGNGYVYRPVYGEQPFHAPQHFGSYGVVTSRGPLFHGTRGNALVIDYPGTPHERRYSPTVGVERGHAVLIDVMPHYYASNAYYADEGFVDYGVPAAYVGPSVDTVAPPADGVEPAEELPSGDLRLRDGTIIPKSALQATPRSDAKPTDKPKLAPSVKPKKPQADDRPKPKKMEPQSNAKAAPATKPAKKPAKPSEF